ncbi:unnamed protein product [Phytophthora lilii]|uniref:Unnamed protein product n=1 Tax=Phytophthora lilii TaxID=2077276 RepID=A0A9W6YJR5_9STRA|nr:unnamed protein product [Phytophthora lilii]
MKRWTTFTRWSMPRQTIAAPLIEPVAGSAASTLPLSNSGSRHQFDTDEKACVEAILASHRGQKSTAAARTAAGGSGSDSGEDDGTCPIPSARLHQHFTEVNTPRANFEPMAPLGAAFRAALARLPAATEASTLLTEAPTVDEIEDQLQRAKGTTSPGLDGVVYDVYKKVTVQLLPALHAAFTCCWRYQRAGSWASCDCCTRRALVRTQRTGGPSASSR